MLNKCFFIGKVSCMPRVKEVKFKTLVFFDILIEERWKDSATKEWQKRVDFFKCCAMSEGLIEPAKNLKKGDILHIEGKLRLYKSKDQNNIESEKVIIDVIHIRKLGDLASLKSDSSTTYMKD